MSIRLILIIIILIIAVVLGFTLAWPKYQSFQQIQLDLGQKKAELDSKTAYYSKVKEIWGKLEGYEDVLSQIDSAIPQGYSLPVLFNYFQKITGETGLLLEDLTFGGAAGEQVKEININLQVSGAYSSLKTFLSVLENSVRFFKVRSIVFTASEKDETLSFDIGITTYSY